MSAFSFNVQTQPNKTGFSFGAPQQGNTGFSLGNNTASNAFGSKPLVSSAPMAAAPGGGFSFSSAPQPVFAFSSSAATQPVGAVVGFNQQQGVALPTTYWEELLFFSQLTDPKSPHCRFKKYLYNLVNPKEVHLYGKPPNESEELYQQAVLNNEDPSCMVPVLVSGPSELKKRLDAAMKEANSHANLAKALRSVLHDLQGKHVDVNVLRVADCKRRQQVIAHRILKVIRQYHVLRSQSHALKPEEEALKQQFENMQAQIRKPAFLSGKLLALKTRLEQIKQIADWQQNESQEGASFNIYNSIQTLDSSAKESFFKILLENQSGIADAMSLVLDDLKTVKDLKQQYTHLEKLMIRSKANNY